jgi:hypothetical protein
LRTQTVRLALDADAGDNPHVARALLACAETLPCEGFTVELERWNKVCGKGLDDLLVAGKVPELLRGDEALAAVRAIAAAAGVEGSNAGLASNLYVETPRRRGYSVIHFSVKLEI